MSDVDNTQRTFTQEDVDRIVQTRLSRRADEFAEQATKISELEQRAARVDELEQRAARVDELEARTHQALVGEAVARTAIDRGIHDIDAATRLLNPELIEVREQGVDVTVALDALLEDKPYLRAQTARGSADQGARSGGGGRPLTREDLASMSAPEYDAARAAGRLKQFGVG